MNLSNLKLVFNYQLFDFVTFTFVCSNFVFCILSFSLIHKSDEGILSTVNSRNLLDDSLIEENTLDLSNLNLSPSQYAK